MKKIKYSFLTNANGICLFCLAFFLFFGQYVNAQTIIFEDGFETGNFKPQWTARPGADGGLVQVVSSIGDFNTTNTAHTDFYAAAMGRSTDGALTTNQLDLTLDLSTYTQVEMTFWLLDYGDETHPEDGIFFSNNGGATFTKVYSFRPADWNNSYGQLPALDIDKLASDAGLTLTNQFVIRFQQHDDADFTGFGDEDGFLIDDVSVYVPTLTYATLPFADGFEAAKLGSMWQRADAFRKGNTGAETTIVPNSLVEPRTTIGDFNTTNTAHTGNYAVAMGKLSDGILTTNALDLHLNLANETQVEMTFWILDYGDETHPEDGIFFSNNGGTTFTKVYSFRPFDWNNNYGQLPPLDIDKLASDAGLTLTNQFVIRFQQHDDADFTGFGDEDGFLIDDVSVYVPTLTYATLPFADGFEAAKLGSMWQRADAFRKGNTGAETTIVPNSLVEPRTTIGDFNTTNTAHTGSYAVAMGKRSDGNLTTNALDLHLNLADETQVEMTFWLLDYGDETHPEDGIYFSNNGGTTFTKVYNFTPETVANSYTPYALNVTQLATNASLTLTNQFVIRFQQYDDADFTGFGDEDGFLIDDVKVENPLKPYITDFTPGAGPEGVQVTVQGGNFQDHGTISVQFNNTDVPASDITLVSDEVLIAKVPEGATTGKISIRNPNGTGLSRSNFVVTSETVLAPASLAATAGNAVVNLDWQNQATNDIEIVVERATTTPTNFQVLVALPNTAESYVDNTVVNGTPYYYRLRAFSILGSSPYSNTANATPTGGVAPTAPSELSVTAPSTSTVPRLELAWADNSDNEEGFEIWRSLTTDGTFTKIITVPTNTTTYTDITGLSAATQYCYKVRAFNANGGNETGIVCTTTQSVAQVPTAPSNLVATTSTIIEETQIDLSWEDNSNNETGFELLRATTENGPFVPIVTLAANTTTFSNIGLAFDTQYFYKIVAFNEAGDSQESNVASATSQSKVTGLEELKNLEITAYPNPIQSVLYLESEKWTGEDVKVVIFNTQGKKILEQNFKNPGTKIIVDISQYPKGYYILNVLLSQTAGVFKFIKE